MNTFCTKECTGGVYDKIKGCEDRWCPFYAFRYMDLDWQVIRKGKHESKQSIVKK